MFLLKEHLYDLVTHKTKGLLADLLRGFLFILSLVYGLIVMILAFFYRLRPVKFKAKVISVGNITLGGTGKTTCVEYLTGKLISQGKGVAVLSRGYKSGDEPAMLQNKFPLTNVIVDKNRVKAAFKAIKDYAADTLILDDGFQQWRIAKDLEIVTIDAQNPFGNNRLLPAGFLREPFSALKRADIFILTQTDAISNTDDLVTKLKRINPQALIAESIHKPVGFNSIANPDNFFGSDSFKNKRAVVFSGIGNPQGFENCICGLGINIAKSFRFIDHYAYTQADLDNIIKEVQQTNADTIITTQKDAIKIRELKISGTDMLALNIKLSITKNEAEFHRRLLKLYSL